MKIQKDLFSNNSNFNEILSKAGLFFVLKILGLLLGYYFTYIVTKKFGSNIYGLTTLGFAIFMIFSVISKFGFDLSFTKQVSSGTKKKNDLIGLFYKINLWSLGISISLCGLILIFNEYICSVFFKKPQFEPYLFWTALTFPFWSLILINAGLYRGLKKNLLFSFYTTFGRFFLTLFFLLIALFLIDFKINETPIIVHFIAIVILAVSAFFNTKRIWKKTSIKSKLSSKLFIRESFPIFISSSVFILLTWLDRIFIGIYNKESDLAIYDVAAKLGLLVSFNLDAINSILAPKISGFFHSNNKVELNKTIKFVVRISSLVSILTFLILISFSDFFLGIFGKEYESGKWVLIILAFGQLINCISGSVGLLLQMTGHQKIYQNIMIYGLILNICLNLILIKPLGIIGVAIATMSSYVLWNLLGVFYVKKHLGVSSYFNPFKQK